MHTIWNNPNESIVQQWYLDHPKGKFFELVVMYHLAGYYLIKKVFGRAGRKPTVTESERTYTDRRWALQVAQETVNVKRRYGYVLRDSRERNPVIREVPRDLRRFMFITNDDNED